ncbi:uncharacterized protein LOC114742799 [Neltuma alba]|nr:uncharacterized protein LOC114742799 [Prosopis alba]
MDGIEERYFGSSDDDGNKDQSNSSSNASPSLTAYSFAGLFMVIGTFSLLALAVSENHIWRKPVMLAKTYSQQFLSPNSTRINPLEETSTRNVDNECSADTKNIGSAENEADNKTLPV